MSARALVGVRRLARVARPYLVEAGYRSGIVVPRGILVPVLAVTAVAVVMLVVLAFGGRVLPPAALTVPARFRSLPLRMLSVRMFLGGRVRLFGHPGDGLPDQLLDRRDASGVGGR